MLWTNGMRSGLMSIGGFVIWTLGWPEIGAIIILTAIGIFFYGYLGSHLRIRFKNNSHEFVEAFEDQEIKYVTKWQNLVKVRNGWFDSVKDLKVEIIDIKFGRSTTLKTPFQLRFRDRSDSRSKLHMFSNVVIEVVLFSVDDDGANIYFRGEDGRDHKIGSAELTYKIAIQASGNHGRSKPVWFDVGSNLTEDSTKQNRKWGSFMRLSLSQ